MAGVSRDDLKKVLAAGKLNPVQEEIVRLRLQYSDIKTNRNLINKRLKGVERIHPTILPIQASGRWSYLNPNISGLSKECISPSCPDYEHERTYDCWALTDCLIPDPGSFWVCHDLDAVEHRIFCLVVDWKERLAELKTGVDIHTPVACMLFSLPLPSNLFNPHTGVEDERWRADVKWQGKDDRRRTMGKNLTYGQGQYCYVKLVSNHYRARPPYRVYAGVLYTPTVVWLIPNIESRLVLNEKGELVKPDYEQLAINFIEGNIEIQKKKAVIMERCRVDRYSRTLYGAKRYGWFKNSETAKQLFNHIVQGTVASYIDESSILLQRRFPQSYLVHNHHDSLKWCFSYSSTSAESRVVEEQKVLTEVKQLCQRSLAVDENEIDITATFKIVRGK